MDNFARLPNHERLPYFQEAAAQRGMALQIIEKDFWVCWGLRRLFSLTEFKDHLTFKGGTSLSKVFRVIERFSEDVDVAIEREFLGFGGAKEPEKGETGKEQQRRIEELKATCQEAVANQLAPQLHAAIGTALQTDVGWTLTRDSSDPDQQSLQFQYPQAVRSGLSPYFATSVKFEFGARSDHFPVESGCISSYIAEELPTALPDSRVHVRALSAVRTFWEKATILHMLHHQPTEKKIAPRMSRHYYDAYCLARGPLLDQILGSLYLLDRVADFKRVYFKAAWAKYEEARPGTLRLAPSQDRAEQLLRDFEDMRQMFFQAPPSFPQILESLASLESRINEAERAR